MKLDIAVIVVNYNYSHFILKNYDVFEQLSKKVKKILIVNDQSDEDSHLQELHKLPIEIFTTKHKKSNENNLNQIKAVYSGLDHIDRCNPKWIWVIDGDDAPTVNAHSVIKRYIDYKSQVMTFGQKVERNKITHDQFAFDRHRFWISGATTSTLIVKASIYQRYKEAIMMEKFPSVWLDIRLSIIAKLETYNLSGEIIVDRLIHENNDSLTYEGDQMKRVIKILNAFRYRNRIR